jgi:hypothetical protein
MPIVLEFDPKVMPKNVCIRDWVEGGAKVDVTKDGRTNQIRRAIVVVVKVVPDPCTNFARRLLGLRGGGCMEGLKTVIVDGMIVEVCIVL